MSKMESEVLVDALPYFDQGYEEPGVREAVSFPIYYLRFPIIVPNQTISGSIFG